MGRSRRENVQQCWFQQTKLGGGWAGGITHIKRRKDTESKGAGTCPRKMGETEEARAKNTGWVGRQGPNKN